MEGFTEGQWEAKGNRVQIKDTPSQTICVCYIQSFEHDKRGKKIEDKRHERNAELISIAPKMHSDLTDLIWLVEQGATQEELKERILECKKTINP